MAILPGSPATFMATIVAADTFEPLPGVSVELRKFDPAIGTFRPLLAAATNSQGQAVFSVNLPADPGTYRYQSYYKGSPEFKADSSPDVSVEIKLSK